jgi:hypothetical protein
MRNQDIQALVNTGRIATVNSARITGVKHDEGIKPASADEVLFHKKRKQSYDWRTGLNLYDDERLIRSREARILAVDNFNSPSCCSKTEIFAVLANIAFGCGLKAIRSISKSGAGDWRISSYGARGRCIGRLLLCRH